MSAAKAKKEHRGAIENRGAIETKTIRVRQVRSGIGCPIEMRETLRALGLGKLHRVTERVDTPETRGMIKKIPHLVQIVEE